MPSSPGDDGLAIRPGIVIPSAELIWRYAAAGGPGGQHANTANTRVELVWSPASTTAVGDALRARLVARLGDEVRVVAADERSQLRNRQLGARRLAEKVRTALVVPRRRVATAPTAGSRARRREAKAAQSQRKADRRRPGVDRD
jgi:ribosome-associated protein